MTKPLFEGVCTALVTPFSGDRIHISMLRKLLWRQMEAGIPAILVSGTTGESPTLSEEEKELLIRETKSYVGDQALVIAGTGSNDTAHAIRSSRAAEKAGADALLVVSPYYNKATPEGLVAHYSAIAEATSLPLILYNVPGRTGMDIPVEVCRALQSLPNVAGIKEASPDLRKAAHFLREPPFPLWSGNDDLILPLVSLGASGVISVLSNVLPGETAALTEAALRGERKKAKALFDDLLPLVDALFSEVNPIPVKEAMKCLGYDCGPCRLPLTEMTKKHRERLINCLTR